MSYRKQDVVTPLQEQLQDVHTAIDNKSTVKSVQRGVAQLSFDGANNEASITISAVNTDKSAVIIHGPNVYSGGTENRAEVARLMGQLTSSTNLKITASGGRISAWNDGDEPVGWQVIEYE